jgi:hypothetical protein
MGHAYSVKGALSRNRASSDGTCSGQASASQLTEVVGRAERVVVAREERFPSLLHRLPAMKGGVAQERRGDKIFRKLSPEKTGVVR